MTRTGYVILQHPYYATSICIGIKINLKLLSNTMPD